MPAEKITTATVNNGPNDTHTLTLRVAWGPKGTAPEAPDGWVNNGYVEINMLTGTIDGTNEAEYTGLQLTEDEVDHLLRVLRRAKRKVWPARQYL